MSNKKLFVCDRFHSPTFTVSAEDWKDVDGRAIKIKAERITFKRMPYKGNWRGEFEANEKEAAFLLAHPWTENGVIRVEEAAPSPEDREGPEVVSVGAKDAGEKAVVINKPTPADTVADTPKARVGVGRPRKAVAV